MTWSERMKSAWITFKREALPLYAWTLIFIAVLVVLIIAMVLGVFDQLRWTIPHIYEGSFSSGMPVPGVPPAPNFAPSMPPFGSLDDDPFAYFGGYSNFSRILSAMGSVVGTLALILIVGWLIGSAFYAGLFNLTQKAYREKVSFKDFRFKGVFRFLGWQGFIVLIQLLLLIAGLIGVFSLRHSEGTIVAFLIVYGLFIALGLLFLVPWFASSSIYLLAHGHETFWVALSGSWRFFRRHMGSLWGLIGTVILIQIAIEILMGISSSGLAGLANLIISPFIAVLTIVWVLSLEDDERKKADDLYDYSTTNSTNPYPQIQTPIITPPVSASPDIQVPPSEHASEMSSPEVKSTQQFNQPQISLHKPQPVESLPNIPAEPVPNYSNETPHFCPSCGKPNAGTAYCPKCGTKL
ncbi:zinc ribbon domain-containing protein [Desulfosporosinus sp. BICA1-9]|uniref:zinc ribbon domain-containing protein n=1 Tax=Desulfosporosinus sp. BICA1-9 TaxID=1531958 RepID=UPI00054B45D2|nr:zinc ribbon domain-containing protein [Desulfosporosinus sp. BICA1-9]KJS83766.1 MAG: membrane protein [Desulfosporosinus sp. BICA1-9]HBW37025.1 zinc ribbon domain-containing protein [Desulfosporosinus sp.]